MSENEVPPRGPPRWFHVLCVIWALAALLVSFSIVPRFPRGILLVLAGALLGLGWIVMLAWNRGFRRPRPFLLLPALVLLLVALHATRAPLRLRVWWDEAALREAVADPGRTRAGSFDILGHDRRGDETLLKTEEGFLFAHHGLCYAPHGGPPRTRWAGGIATTYDPLFGPWWIFHAHE